MTLSNALTFMVYVAALHAQKKQRNYMIVKSKSWINNVRSLQTYLAAHGMTL